MLTIFFLFAMLTHSTVFSSRTFYVDVSTGNDENDGLSENSPWKTIQRVNEEISLLLPGDCVRFHKSRLWEGEYLKIHNLDASGELPITFSTYGEGSRPIIDPSVSIPSHLWTPSSIGDGVYEIQNNISMGFDPAEIVTVQNGETLRVAGIWRDYIYDGSALEWLTYPPDGEITYDQKIPVKFWDGIEAFWGTSADGIYKFNGYTYFRSRNKEHPSTFSLRAAGYDHRGIDIRHSSHIIVSGFHVRACKYNIYAQRVSYITIDDCFLQNGGKRMYIEFGSNITISNNELVLSYFGFDKHGGDTEGDVYASTVRYHVYRTFKTRIGSASSDDCGISLRFGGSNCTIINNFLHDGLVGVSYYDPDIVANMIVTGNVFANFTSIGFTFSENLYNFNIYQNFFFNSAINLRYHHLNSEADCRKGSIHENLFWNPGFVSSHHFFHFWTGENYTDNIPEVTFRNNLYTGALRALYLSDFALPSKLGKLNKTSFYNNIFSSYEVVYAGTEVIHSDEQIFANFDDNIWAGNYHHGVPSGHPGWFGPNNVLLEGTFLWTPVQRKLKMFRLPTTTKSRLMF